MSKKRRGIKERKGNKMGSKSSVVLFQSSMTRSGGWNDNEMFRKDRVVLL